MMKNAYRRIRVATTLMAAASLLVPADAQAFLGLCQKRQNAAAALYGGTVCNPCGQQLVVNYVPQTCYRTQTVQVPVTTYRPVCSADPCTGCQTTVMRPVVNYQQQVQYVPYSSYRLQYSIAQPACPTATTSYYAPAPTSGIGAPAMTYAAPAATYAAPTSGCSSCNSGAATTSYYAPSTSYPVTTNYAAPRLLAPTTALPRATNVYSYPTTPGNVNVGGYNYATPSAAGITSPSTYGSSSFTPAYSAPAASSPSYAAPVYSAPMSANPATAIPAYSSPSYASPSYSTPVPSLSGSSMSGTTLNGTTLSLAPPPTSSSATAGSAYYTPSTGSYPVGSYPAGAMVPVPGAMTPTLAPSSSIPPTTTYSNPVPTLSNPASASPTLTLPGTTTAPARLPYSSGVSPSGTSTPAAPMQQPIPDVEINRSLRMGPTSTPALIDPEDKTAMAWPARRAWDYRVVGNVMPASLTTVATQEAPVQRAVAQEAVAPSAMPQLPPQPTFAHTQTVDPSATARLGAPREAMEIEVMYAPQPTTVQQPVSQPQVDRDGWSSASR